MLVFLSCLLLGCAPVPPGLTPGLVDGVDADGDGVTVEEGDCDDSDPTRWEPISFYDGDVHRDWETFCDGYCTRGVDGDLDPSRSGDESIGASELAALSCVFVVTGDMRLSGIQGTSTWEHFTQLQRVGGTLSLFYDDGPWYFDGLDRLTQVGGLHINGVDSLVSLSGLGALRTADTLLIDDNDGLLSLEGAGALEDVGRLSIQWNARLVSTAGLAALRRVHSVDVTANYQLVDLDGLQRVREIHGDLVVKWNSRLQDVHGLGALERVGGDLQLSGNPLLRSPLGADRLGHVGGSLWIADNDDLQTLDGLDGLRVIEGDLYILKNEQLADLSALKGLERVGGDIGIWGNLSLDFEAIEDLLGAIDEIGGRVRLVGIHD